MVVVGVIIQSMITCDTALITVRIVPETMANLDPGGKIQHDINKNAWFLSNGDQ